MELLIVIDFDLGIHECRETTASTGSVLEWTGRFDVRVCEDVGIFESLAIEDYDALLLYYSLWRGPDPIRQTKQGLLNYVQRGLGFCCLCESFGMNRDLYRVLSGLTDTLTASALTTRFSAESLWYFMKI